MWKGKWIWIDAEKNPHNKFVWFERDFSVTKVEKAEIRITAETRYELYVNERFVGKGPVRSWPFEYSYDTYDIADNLVKGKNVVTVLVHHFGISTFQSNEGPAGFLADIEIKSGGKKSVISTDSSWSCRPEKRFSPTAPRMSCQLAFCEIFDANAKPDNWKKALEVCPPKEKELVKRDIPLLSFEYLYPKRIASIRRVKKPPMSISFDLRPCFLPENLDANIKIARGFLCFKIVSGKETEGKICLSAQYMGGEYKLNGELLKDAQSQDHKTSYAVRLKKGDNLLVVKINGGTHLLTTQMVLDFSTPVKIKGINQNNSYGDVVVFNALSHPWTAAWRQQFEKNPAFDEIWENADERVIKKYSNMSKPVVFPFFCTENVFPDILFSEEKGNVKIDENYSRLVYSNDSCAVVKNEGGDTEIVIDFGQEFSGYIEFDVFTKEGTVLDFYIFEHISDETGVPLHMFNLNNTLRYKCKNGRQKFRSFVRRGGRFLNLTIREKAPVKIYSLNIINSSFPVSYRGVFRTHDHTLMNIFKLAGDTTRACMEDTYVDCPTFEQTFWVGDARNESLVNFYTFGAYEITKRCLNLVPKSMFRSPIPESQVPSGWANVLTDWALFWVNACREYYDFTGDEDFLKEIYPWLMKTAKGFEGFINKKNLLEINAWNMLDWAPMDCPTFGVVTHQNAFLVKSLNDIIYLAGLLKKDDDEKYLQGMKERVKKGINEHLFSEEKQAFYDSIHEDGKPSNVFSIQTQTAVFLSDAATDERMNRLKELILNPPDDFVKIGSPFMSFFYLEALAKMGEFQKMLDYIRKNWGERMLDKGAVTCWECFDKTRSHCHAWSAAPGYFLSAYILGIRPGAPGFKKMIVDPKPCDLKWVRGCVPTPKGDIYIEWKKNEDGTLSIKTTPPLEG